MYMLYYYIIEQFAGGPGQRQRLCGLEERAGVRAERGRRHQDQRRRRTQQHREAGGPRVEAGVELHLRRLARGPERRHCQAVSKGLPGERRSPPPTFAVASSARTFEGGIAR